MGKILNTYLNNKPKEIVIKGDGQYIISNKKYLDFTGGGTSNCVLGFNHPKVIQSITAQLKKISNIDYKQWVDENRYRLSNLLTKIHPKIKQCFFLWPKWS